MDPENKEDSSIRDLINSLPSDPVSSVLPSPETVQNARQQLHSTIPTNGLGLRQTVDHIARDIVPGLNHSSRSPNYYGFVTGGATPAAAYADNIVTAFDQNVGVHLPNEAVTTDVEDRALRMLCQLLRFEPEEWPHRILTTGATASNVVGLALGREYVVVKAAERRGGKGVSVGELGLVKAMSRAGLDDVQILTTVPHSSLRKAASLVGLGRDSMVDISLAREGQSHKFDLEALELALRKERVGSIVAISCSEVNTGLFATSGAEEMKKIRRLCDEYGAWIHVDGAFGILARTLPQTSEYHTLTTSVDALSLADSITGDNHKLLNVPYDSGFLFSKSVPLTTSVFQNAGAAYLATSNGPDSIPSPMNIGIENSRRFRALPLYATLLAYGVEGYSDMLVRQNGLARRIAAYIQESPAYELLPDSSSLENIYIIVLFRAAPASLNSVLVKRINESRKIYVSGTEWDGVKACRFAVANWGVDVERDFGVVKDVLEEVAKEDL
ncbi:PLP-dependent transferase [Aulographum hederae CBS 113979]|uniref:PLP-dependent transferase n=1 Tax=Aulographum hederae CBS 113979 TaxID=1176131 RepID=A0A6G1H332_9PEZI|nr:PLP-dependent transferase [Aulographum hederae CBS 113979]